MGWKFWKKKKKEEVEVRVKDDLSAVTTFLKDLEVNGLVKDLEKMKDKVREERIVSKELKSTNLKKQVEFFDNILKEYTFFETDTDINGIRLRMIGKELLRKAEAAGFKEIVKAKKKDINWRF